MYARCCTQPEVGDEETRHARRTWEQEPGAEAVHQGQEKLVEGSQPLLVVALVQQPGRQPVWPEAQGNLV